MSHPDTGRHLGTVFLLLFAMAFVVSLADEALDKKLVQEMATVKRYFYVSLLPKRILVIVYELDLYLYSKPRNLSDIFVFAVPREALDSTQKRLHLFGATPLAIALPGFVAAYQQVASKDAKRGRKMDYFASMFISDHKDEYIYHYEVVEDALSSTKWFFWYNLSEDKLVELNGNIQLDMDYLNFYAVIDDGHTASYYRMLSGPANMTKFTFTAGGRSEDISLSEADSLSAEPTIHFCLENVGLIVSKDANCKNNLLTWTGFVDRQQQMILFSKLLYSNLLYRSVGPFDGKSKVQFEAIPLVDYLNASRPPWIKEVTTTPASATWSSAVRWAIYGALTLVLVGVAAMAAYLLLRKKKRPIRSKQVPAASKTSNSKTKQLRSSLRVSTSKRGSKSACGTRLKSTSTHTSGAKVTQVASKVNTSPSSCKAKVASKVSAGHRAQIATRSAASRALLAH